MVLCPAGSGLDNLKIPFLPAAQRFQNGESKEILDIGGDVEDVDESGSSRLLDGGALRS